MISRAIKTLMILIVATVAPAKPPKAAVQIFFIPFGIRTYAPVTELNIEEQAFVCVYFKHDWVISNIESCISRTPSAKMEGRQIRLKIVINSDTYLFDSSGNGRKNGTENVRLDVARIGAILGEDRLVAPLGPQSAD